MREPIDRVVENARTQPLRRQRVFNNPETLPEAWYPVCSSRELASGGPRSIEILTQRLAVFRGSDGRPRALDAFCPHMGADLANGSIVDDRLKCFFHGWCFGGDGRLDRASCGEAPASEVRVNSYPTEEKYGFVWVYAGARAPYPVPEPPQLEGRALRSVHQGSPTLLAHHHLMMANGIDLRHFSSVHGLPAAFEHSVEEGGPGVFDWNVGGDLPSSSLPLRLLRSLLGPRIGYVARFAGGSFVSITYGPDQRLPATGWRWPPLHIVWGCVPLSSGVSRVHVFLVTPRRSGAVGRIVEELLLTLTGLLLKVLKDDDRKGFAHIRFSLGRLTPADASVAQFVRRIEELPLSAWSPIQGPTRYSTLPRGGSSEDGPQPPHYSPPRGGGE